MRRVAPEGLDVYIKLYETLGWIWAPDFMVWRQFALRQMGMR